MVSDLPSLSPQSHGLLPATDAEHGIAMAPELLTATRRALTLLLGVSLGDWLVGEGGMRMGCGHDADRFAIELSA